MYHTRVKIFIAIIGCLLAVCVLRLAQMQLLPNQALRDEIEALKRQRIKTLQTARGRILDRHGQVLAADEPRFEIQIGYDLIRCADARDSQASFLRAGRRTDPEKAIEKFKKQRQAALLNLQHVIEACSRFGLEPDEATERIEQINDRIWNFRRHLAWKRNYADYNDFTLAVPDANERLLLIAKVDIKEMHWGYSLLELADDADVFNAQLALADVNGVAIVPANHRLYPCGSVAAQTIGWIGPEQKKTLFADDRLASYRPGELSGRPPGVEYVCEPILRGRRGEIVRDYDRELIGHTQSQIGRDVTLTLDIELQQKIEQHFLDAESNPTNYDKPSAAVVIDVASGGILAAVSLPVYDLNSVRQDYGRLINNPDRPLTNRTINEHYPPGSVAKPLILIAGLESGKIAANEVINCPAEPAPKGWPSCWIYNKFQSGHDWAWPNNARNAIRGSCNIYFSRLANRLEPVVLQQWLFKFGYGRKILPGTERHFQQVTGTISSVNPKGRVENFDDIDPLNKGELRYFGIGQGNFRVTPLQVANAMAAIARGGLYKAPQLIIDESAPRPISVSLDISPYTLRVIHDGMAAVVNKQGGTANGEFRDSLRYFSSADVKVYGKTGSTQSPEVAWFGGFAKDSKGRSISLAVVVEGGQQGSKDAAPLAREIFRFCIEAGYIGNTLSK
jgi:penicillin-binding protein 2